MKTHVLALAPALALILGTALAPVSAQAQSQGVSALHTQLSRAPRGAYTAMTSPDRDLPERTRSLATVPGTKLDESGRFSGTLHLFGTRTDDSPY